MRRAIPLFFVVVGICGRMLLAGPSVLDEPTRLRVVKYGFAATQLAGMPGSHVVDFITDKTGADRSDVVDRLQKIRGRVSRDADSLVAERVGILVANADVARVDAAIRDGLCKPLADEADTVALAACRSRQAQSLLVRLCRVSNGAHVAMGARFALTGWMRDDVRSAIQALSPAPQVVVVRNDDGQAAWQSALANNVPPLRLCEDGE